MNDQAPLQLRGSQRKWLRGQAHDLEPVIHVGQAGLTEAVIAAIDKALLDHELIKVKLRAPEDKKALAAAMAVRCGAAAVGLVGHVVILYRPRPEEPRLKLPA